MSRTLLRILPELINPNHRECIISCRFHEPFHHHRVAFLSKSHSLRLRFDCLCHPDITAFQRRRQDVSSSHGDNRSTVAVLPVTTRGFIALHKPLTQGSFTVAAEETIVSIVEKLRTKIDDNTPLNSARPEPRCDVFPNFSSHSFSIFYFLFSRLKTFQQKANLLNIISTHCCVCCVSLVNTFFVPSPSFLHRHFREFHLL